MYMQDTAQPIFISPLLLFFPFLKFLFIFSPLSHQRQHAALRKTQRSPFSSRPSFFFLIFF